MGQASHSGRNASLDQKKRRAAGRQKSNSPERKAARDEGFAKGKPGGAFGKQGVANRRRGTAAGIGHDASAAKSGYLNVGASTHRQRKRKA